MLLDHFLDQTGITVVPAADDEVFCAAGNMATARLVGVGEIAAVDQTLPDSGVVVLRIAIARRDDRPRDREDADLMGRAALSQRPNAFELPHLRLDVGNPEADGSDHPLCGSRRERYKTAASETAQ